MTRRRVLVVVPGHVSTTPRMLRAADSLAAAGYDVRVVSARYDEWPQQADGRTAATRTWRWQRVTYGRREAPVLHAMTGARRHAARLVARRAGPETAPWWAVTRALSRAHDQLVAAGLHEPFDLVYGGSVGGLAVVEEIARKRGAAFGIDLEDLHTAESASAAGALQHALARRVLGVVLPRASFVTTSTECMAESYAAEFGVAPAVIHNVCRLPARPPSFDRRPGPLRLYWFSQTIGPARGIEDAIAAVNYARIPAELTLRGRATGDYISSVHRIASSVSSLVVRVEPPADPDRMVDLCADHDVGLSGEQQHVRNNQVCLGNKIFTYLAAGIPVALSDTEAQRRLARELGDAAFVYSPPDHRALGDWLRALAASESRLRAHRQAAWDAAVRRWHWHHEAEEGKLLSLISLVERSAA